MKDIAIYGAGGLGREVACLICIINESQPQPSWHLIGFFDDGKPVDTPVSHYGKVLGGVAELNAWDKPICVAIAIGTPNVLRNAHQGITNPKVTFPNIIHPSFETADVKTFRIGHGNIIQGNCFASCDVSIGNFNIFNGDIIMGHDVQIGDYNSIMSKAWLAGEVCIGNCNLLGVGSIVIQKIKIGDGIRLSPGSVLLTRPKDNSTYIGNPARRFKY